jgi:hypothetical protein
MQFGDDYNMLKYVKVGSGRVFVRLGDHVRVLTPIIGCHSNAKLCININDVVFDKKYKFLYCLCKHNICAHINYPI